MITPHLLSALVLVLAPAEAPAPQRDSTLDPIAREHQREGDRAASSGDHAEAHWHYVRAYDLSRLIADQEAREVLRVQIDRTLHRLFEARGDVNYLCQSWDFHEHHIQALQREGLATAAAPLAGVVAALREEIARASGSRPERVCAARGRARPLTIAGGILAGLGVSGLGLAAYGLAVNVADYRHLQALKEQYPDGPDSPLERDLAANLVDHGNTYRDLAIVAGVAGSVVTAVAAALLVRARRVRPAAPRLRAGMVGLSLRF